MVVFARSALSGRWPEPTKSALVASIVDIRALAPCAH